MQQQAPVIIKALLSAYLEVSKAHKLTLRTLTPSTVMLDRSFSQVIFSDISEMCEQDDGSQPSTHPPLPYSAMLLPAYRKSPRCHTIFDRWSVGVIMLEILLGTGAVMTIHSFAAAEELIQLSRKFLDKDTVAVLRYLLFATKSPNAVTLEQYCQRLEKSPDELSQAICRLEAAVSEGGELADLLQSGKLLIAEKSI